MVYTSDYIHRYVLCVNVNIIYYKYDKCSIDKATMEPPVGDMLFTSRTDPGNKYLPCDGDYLSETSYPDLYKIMNGATPNAPFKKSVLYSGKTNYSTYSGGIAYGNGYYAYIGTVSSTVTIFYSTNIDGPFTIGNSYTIDSFGASKLYFLNGYFLFGFYQFGSIYKIRYATLPTETFTEQTISNFIDRSVSVNFTYSNGEFGLTTFAGNAWRYIYSKTLNNSSWKVKTIGFSGDGGAIKLYSNIGIGNYVYAIAKQNNDSMIIKYGSLIETYDIIFTVASYSYTARGIVYDGKSIYIVLDESTMLACKIYCSSDFVNFNLIDVPQVSKAEYQDYNLLYSNGIYILYSSRQYHNILYTDDIYPNIWINSGIQNILYSFQNYVYNETNKQVGDNYEYAIYYIDTSKKAVPFINVEGTHSFIRALK